MGSVSSEDGSDQQSDRCGSYSLSADISESESSSSFCGGRRFDTEGASSSANLSPPPGVGNFKFPAAQVMMPVIGGKDGVLWNHKPEKRDLDLSVWLMWSQLLPQCSCVDCRFTIAVVDGNLKPVESRAEMCAEWLSEVEMMKERFAKLLLGEDMSGGGKGVCTALAISNAITNLSATVFGELWRLEPLAAQKKAMWRREMEWLLCVSDSIVELVPSVQQFPGGGTYEVMAMRPRSDLYINLPALKKLDGMLIGMLDGFEDTQFWYVDKGIVLGDSKDCDDYSGRPSVRQEEKWWLPSPKVPPNGLSEDDRKRLQQCRDCTNQILKAAMAINSSVLVEMEIPRAYVESLPKNGKACLGDIIYRYITADQFLPECLLDCLDLSSEHHTLDVANRIEAAVHVWRLKGSKKHSNSVKARRSWGGKVKGLVADSDRSHFLSQRAETLLQSLKHRFPGLPQTALDMAKIQYNKDVGQSILESYSRVMESLAFNIIARIDDVLYVDDAIKRCAAAESISLFSRGGFGGMPVQKRMSPSPFSIQHTPYASPFATPSFCSSSPVTGSPCSPQITPIVKRNGRKEATDSKPEKLVSADSERVWSFTGNLSSRRASGDAPERD